MERVARRRVRRDQSGLSRVGVVHNRPLAAPRRTRRAKHGPVPVSSLLAAAGDLVDLVLPRYCLGCRAPGAALCARCAAPQVQLVDVARLRVTAGAVYDGAVRTALLAYKERDRRDLVPALRRLLTAALAAQTCSPGVLVPVPSSAVARRARGGDHVLRLLPRRMPRRQVLRLIRTVRDSAGLDAHARR